MQKTLDRWHRHYTKNASDHPFEAFFMKTRMYQAVFKRNRNADICDDNNLYLQAT